MSQLKKVLGSSMGSGIDPSLRERVTKEINVTKDALDSVASAPSDHTLETLRNAVDHLMRALARVLIEIDKQHEV